ncbi:hypothetical protein BDV19DRAFT_316795 [Aspergillus venezuelensis]
MYFRLIAVISALVALMAPASVCALPQPQPQAPTPIPVSPTILRESPFSKEVEVEVEVEEEVEVETEVETNEIQNQPRNADYTFHISLLNDTMSEPETNGHLQKRHIVSCTSSPMGGALIPVTDGIEYLRKRKGRPDLDPGYCEWVSCSYNDAIFWCNTGHKKFYLPSYNFIADGAQEIKNQCWNKDPRKRFGGYIYHPDHWYAGVRGNKFKC